MDPIAHAVQRGSVMGQIQSCTACPLVTSATSPVPFRGRSPNRLMIVGEAPGQNEDKYGRPFVGMSGKAMNQLLSDVGLPPLSDWFVTHACCCRSVGPPPPESIKACTPNLRAQIQLADPDWILLLGATALTATGFKGKISQVHGRHFHAPAGPFIGRWCFPTYHPAAGLRDETVITKINGDLSTLSRLLSGTVSADVGQLRVGKNGKLIP